MQYSACPSNHILLAWFSGNGVAGQLIHSYYSTLWGVRAGGMYHYCIWRGEG